MILTAKYIQHYIKGNYIDTTKPSELNLSYNQISSIEKDAFDGLDNLNRLDLSNNHISSIAKIALDGLHNLKELNLSGNQITSIENKCYKSREEILNLIEKLKSLENNGSISDLKNNNCSKIMGQDCDTINYNIPLEESSINHNIPLEESSINHNIPLEKSSKIFEEIAKIRQNRPALHGSARDNFKKIAALWSAYLDTEVTIQDVGFMMSMLKAARHKNGDKNNMDNFFDGSNYIALAGEEMWDSLFNLI